MVEIMKAASEMTWPGAFAIACVSLSGAAIAFAWGWMIRGVIESNASNVSTYPSDEETNYTFTREEK